MSTNIVNFDNVIDDLPTYAKNVKQLILLAEFTILAGDTIQFTQRDIADEFTELGPLIVMNETTTNDAALDIRITYNSGSTVDVTIPAYSEVYSYEYTDYKLAYQVTNIAFVPATSDKGSEGEKYSVYCMNGYWARTIFLIEKLGAYLRNTMYTFIRYLSLAAAMDDWVDKVGESWGLRRIPGETDTAYKQRIISFVTPTDGTIASVLERVKTFLGLPPETVISVTETYNQSGWILNQSKLLDGGQSELILTGGDSIKSMQFIMTIPYSGSVTEEEVETFLETVVNVGAHSIVRFS